MSINKIIPLCILLVSFAALCSCASDLPEPETPDAQTDFGGESYYFINSFILGDERDSGGKYALAGESAGGSVETADTIEEEALFDHCTVVEKTYNCKVVRYGYSFSLDSKFAAAVSSGEINADIICIEYISLYDMYKAGLLADLHTVSTLDADDYDKWGGQSRRDATTYRGVLYAFPVEGSLYCPHIENYNGALGCNDSTYSLFNVGTTPREMIESGDWTFSDFSELLTSVYSLDADNPILGLGYHNSLETAAIFANGGSVIVKADGKYVFGYTRPEAVHALEWVQSVYAVKGLTGFCYEDSLDNGGATFLLAPVDMLLKCTSGDISWLPFPSGPDVEYGKSSSAYFGSLETGTALFVHEDDPGRLNEVGLIADALFDYTEKYPEGAYGSLLSRWYFSTDADYEAYKAGCIGMNYDWSKEISKSSNTALGPAISKAIEAAVGGTGSVSLYMKSIEDAVTLWICNDLNSAN